MSATIAALTEAMPDYRIEEDSINRTQTVILPDGRKYFVSEEMPGHPDTDFCITGPGFYSCGYQSSQAAVERVFDILFG